MATGVASYGRVFCLISGASRGLGRGLAVKFSNLLAPGSVLFLVARSEQDLIEVKEIIDQKQLDIKVVIKSVDLKNADYESFKTTIKSVFNEVNVTANHFDTALIIHNAGTLGNISGTTLDVDDINELRSYYDLNLFSPILLNSAFFKIFTKENVRKQVAINITSAAAVKPFKTWPYYSSSKAAKEMFFKVMGEEFPEIRVLSYSPGPLKTEMMNHAREQTKDEELRQRLQNFKDDDKLLEVDYSVDRLLSILEADKFKSGARVHVTDPLP